MNGVHDMGGMHGLGPIVREEGEPVFHARWESRVLALTIAMGAIGKWTADASRHARELIPGPKYLNMSYYEKWLEGLTTLSIQAGLLTAEELSLNQASTLSSAAKPALRTIDVATFLGQGHCKSRLSAENPQFGIGSQVCTRNLNPIGHTRLPRYVRGKPGRITRLHGAHVFPDANAHGLGEQPQHLYQVRFEGKDLWGDDRVFGVYLDLWESYLESV